LELDDIISGEGLRLGLAFISVEEDTSSLEVAVASSRFLA
jgi:hypothetical protein